MSRVFVAMLVLLLVSGGRPAVAQDPLPPGAVIPASIDLDVTGTPAAAPAFLDVEIRRALDRAIRPTLHPGASINFGAVVPWPLFALASGTRAAVNVTVVIRTDGASLPLSGVTMVVLNGRVAAAHPPGMLFLSDDPEYLQSEGLVFRGSVTPERPARLYYYHSDIGVPRDVDVLVTATVPSRVRLTASEAGPELDVMDVGHVVSRDFLELERDGDGIVVDVVPGMPFVVRHALLLQGEVVAGAVDIDVLSGAVGVAVAASAAGSAPDASLAGPRVPYDGHRRHGTFDLTSFGDRAETFTVGGSPVSVQIGSRTPTPSNVDPGDDGRDFGDYGVVHRVAFTLVNPTADPHLIYLYEKALGGNVRSSFLVDGALKELGCVHTSQPYLVATYRLPPNSTSGSTTVTMTDGGSFYPLEFGVTETAPIANTPYPGSPDGCSPNTAAAPHL